VPAQVLSSEFQPVSIWFEARHAHDDFIQVVRGTLGKLPGLDEAVQAGWESLDDLLAGRAPARQLELKGSPPLLAAPRWCAVDDRLYRGLDALHEHKEKLTQHLLKRYESWFGVGFEFLIYDVTSTFFEGQAAGNTVAARGYSRDNRPDCQQVCIGLVVSPEGLPLAYEIVAGNRTDVTTVQDIVKLMEEKYGHAKRIWVLDRGMVSEANIEFLRARLAQYIVGTPKAQLRQFEAALLETKDWRAVRPDVEVKLLPHPDGKGRAQFVLCRSQARREKEKAMLARQEERLWQKLREIQHSLEKKPQLADQIERRVGKWLGRYPAADKLFEVEVCVNEQRQACALSVPAWWIAANGRGGRREPICCAPTARSRTRPNCGSGICNCSRPKRPSAAPRAIWACARSFIRKRSGWRHTSSSAFYRWHCGEPWKCG
jgi:hypothetical protein